MTMLFHFRKMHTGSICIYILLELYLTTPQVRSEEAEYDKEVSIISKSELIYPPNGFVTLFPEMGKISKNRIVNLCGLKFTINSSYSDVSQSTIIRNKYREWSFRTWPATIKFEYENKERCFSIHPWNNVEFIFISLYGCKFVLENMDYYIIDTNMNGNISEIGIDGFCGPDCLQVIPLRKEIWTYTNRYEIVRIRQWEDYINIGVIKSLPDLPKDINLINGLCYLNANRQRIGSSPLIWDKDLYDSCCLHAKYCAKNHILTHKQNKRNKYYTISGDIAGSQSVLCAGEDESKEAVNNLLMSVYHCSACLDPGLIKTCFLVHKKVFVMNVIKWLKSDISILQEKTNLAEMNIVKFCWPPNGALNVPMGFHQTGENPMPIIEDNAKVENLGHPIFACLYKPFVSKIENKCIRIRVFDDNGKAVKGYITTPSLPAEGMPGNMNIISHTPCAKLSSSERYSVKISTKPKNKWKPIYSWWFKTTDKEKEK